VFICEDSTKLCLFVTHGECFSGKINIVFVLDSNSNLKYVFNYLNGQRQTLYYVLEQDQFKYISIVNNSLFSRFESLDIGVVSFILELNEAEKSLGLLDSEIKEMPLNNYYMKNMSKIFDW